MFGGGSFDDVFGDLFIFDGFMHEEENPTQSVEKEKLRRSNLKNKLIIKLEPYVSDNIEGISHTVF